MITAESNTPSVDTVNGSKKLFAVDWAILWFYGLLSLLTLLYWREVPDNSKLIAIYGTGMLLVLASSWLSQSWQLKSKLLIRSILACLLITIAFSSLGYLVHHVSPDPRHWHLLNWDRKLLSGDPLRAVHRWGVPVITDLVQFSYASYYFLPMVLGFVLYRQKRWGDFETVLTVVTLGFFISYLGYFLLPARSPNEVLPSLWQKGWYIAEPLARWTREAELNKHDCFPSGHLMLTLITLRLAWRFHRRTFWCLLPFGAGLGIATVYLGYHYVIDLAVGAAAAAAVLYFFSGSAAARNIK